VRPHARGMAPGRSPRSDPAFSCGVAFYGKQQIRCNLGNAPLLRCAKERAVMILRYPAARSADRLWALPIGDACRVNTNDCSDF
jgi:hypothetical protein